MTMEAPPTEEKSHIPRFVAYVNNKKLENSLKKPITPGKYWSHGSKSHVNIKVMGFQRQCGC